MEKKTDPENALAPYMSAVQHELASRAVRYGVDKALSVCTPMMMTPEDFQPIWEKAKLAAALEAKPYIDAIDPRASVAPAPETSEPSIDGKWLVSDDEERWSSTEYFATREEAEAYGKGEYAEEQGLQDGARIWIGQVDTIGAIELASAVVDDDRLLESMQEYIADNVGIDFDDAIEWTREQGKELCELLEAAIMVWMRKHDIKPSCHRIDNVYSVTFEQCDLMVGDPAQRCERFAGHEEGACETTASAIAANIRCATYEGVDATVNALDPADNRIPHGMVDE